MNQVVLIFGTIAVLGSALVAGIFFAFSSFIMKALGNLPAADGIAAMQRINVDVLNVSFLGVFMGTAVLSLGIAGYALAALEPPASIFFLDGALCYFVGTFLVTAVGNVPLNNRLAAVDTAASTDIEFWEHYLKRWTMLNHVRTAAATLAALFYTLGLLNTA